MANLVQKSIYSPSSPCAFSGAKLRPKNAPMDLGPRNQSAVLASRPSRTAFFVKDRVGDGKANAPPSNRAAVLRYSEGVAFVAFLLGLLITGLGGIGLLAPPVLAAMALALHGPL